MPDVLVMGAAIIRHGRVLVARRAFPAGLEGGWEFPGGKVEPGEDPHAAVVREIREELGCEVTVTGDLDGAQPVKPGYTLRVVTAGLVGGEPTPHEHDAVRWLAAEELSTVPWLEPDLPFLPELKRVLLEGERLDGGHVGGAARIGSTVRRATGPWSPAVHRLLQHLKKKGLRAVPEVLGADELDREVLTFMPGHVVDVDNGTLSDGQLASLVAWTRDLHGAVDGFLDDGPWRSPVGEDTADGTLVGHNDIAPYNVCFEGDTLVGVFDWDLSGPTSALWELAFLAWNCVPLTRDIGAGRAAERLELVAATYDGPSARDILDAVPRRIRHMLAWIPAAAQAGDPGMRRLMGAGEPDRSGRTLAGLVRRIPRIEQELP